MTFEEKKNLFRADIEFNRILIDTKVYTISEHFHNNATIVSLEHEAFPKETVRFIGKIPWIVSHSYKVRGRLTNLLLHRLWKPTYEVYWQCVGPVQFSRSEFKELIVESLFRNFVKQ